jgi:hypothetical protein
MATPRTTYARPDFDAMQRFWTDLLRARRLPQTFRWVFYEDYARLTNGFAFRLRPVPEADRLARFAYCQLDPANRTDARWPLAIVAYAVIDDIVITGFQQDVFTSTEDVYREDWNIYFDAKDQLLDTCIIAIDDTQWQRLRVEQPFYLSELDYCVSVEKLKTEFGYIE